MLYYRKHTDEQNWQVELVIGGDRHRMLAHQAADIIGEETDKERKIRQTTYRKINRDDLTNKS